MINIARNSHIVYYFHDEHCNESVKIYLGN